MYTGNYLHLEWNGEHFYHFDIRNQQNRSFDYVVGHRFGDLRPGASHGWYYSGEALAVEDFLIHRSATSSDSLPEGNWTHAHGSPEKPYVGFSWSAEFPESIRYHRELHHIFPCRLHAADGNLVKRLESRWKEKYPGKLEKMFVFSNHKGYALYYNFVFSNIEGFSGGMNGMKAANLQELADKFDVWLSELEARIEKYIEYNGGGKLPTNFIAPFDRDVITSRVAGARNVSIKASKVADRDKVRREFVGLERFIADQLTAAYAFESGLKPKNVLKYAEGMVKSEDFSYVLDENGKLRRIEIAFGDTGFAYTNPRENQFINNLWFIAKEIVENRSQEE